MLTLTVIAAGIWVAAVTVYEGRRSAAASRNLRDVMAV
jgi:hypothetical protein